MSDELNTLVITVRGTGEPRWAKDSILSLVYDRFLELYEQKPGEIVSRVDLAYPASITVANESHSLFGVSGYESVQAGVKSLRNFFVNPDNSSYQRVVVLGYSLGAIVVSEAMALLQPDQTERIRLVGNIANPQRLPNESEGKHVEAGLFGLDIRRPTTLVDNRWIEIANPNDMITASRMDSLWRPWVEEILSFTLTDAGYSAATRFFVDSLQGRNQFPVPLTALIDGRFDRAVSDARGYLNTAHTLDYNAATWVDTRAGSPGDRVSGIELLARRVAGALV